MMQVVFEHAEVDLMLSGLSRKIKNPRPFLQQVGDYIQKQTMRMFRGPRADRQMVRGITWAPLKPSTIKQKRAKGWTDRPLVADGKLMRDLSSPGAIKISGKDLTYGSTIDYAKYHQEGTPKMARRKFVFLNKQDRAEITKLFQKFIRGKV